MIFTAVIVPIISVSDWIYLIKKPPILIVYQQHVLNILIDNAVII